jgi:hypothetical protein
MTSSKSFNALQAFTAKKRKENEIPKLTIPWSMSSEFLEGDKGKYTSKTKHHRCKNQWLLIRGFDLIGANHTTLESLIKGPHHGGACKRIQGYF